ncbi:MAG: TatD family hydrolase [Treponema sp.]|nr:TatD family hydrolase [Treponema sp.]
MATDAHCHPGDLLKRFPAAEAKRRGQGVSCAAGAWNMADFICHETLAQKARQDRAPQMLLCFAVHPQLPATGGEEASSSRVSSLLTIMETLAEQGRLDGIGETGFDLYNPAFRNTEALQDTLFTIHLELALKKGLPLVLHVRKAMHKVFAHTQAFKKLPALIFHSYPGTLGEGEALLRRGINAYFSFGNPIVLGRKETLRSCAGLPIDRVLLETDAPYQNLPGAPFSHWEDLRMILQAAFRLRKETERFPGGMEELERIIDSNFYRAYGILH